MFLIILLLSFGVPVLALCVLAGLALVLVLALLLVCPLERVELVPVHGVLHALVGVLHGDVEALDDLLVLAAAASDGAGDVLGALGPDGGLLQHGVVVDGLLSRVVVVAAGGEEDLVRVLGAVVELDLLCRLVLPHAVEVEAAAAVGLVGVEVLVVAVRVLHVELAAEFVAGRVALGQEEFVVHQVLRFRVGLGVLLVGLEGGLVRPVLVLGPVDGSEESREQALVVLGRARDGVRGELDGHEGSRVGEGVEVGDEGDGLEELGVPLGGVPDALGVLEFLLGELEPAVDLALDCCG